MVNEDTQDDFNTFPSVVTDDKIVKCSKSASIHGSLSVDNAIHPLALQSESLELAGPDDSFLKLDDVIDSSPIPFIPFRIRAVSQRGSTLVRKQSSRINQNSYILFKLTCRCDCKCMYQ